MDNLEQYIKSNLDKFNSGELPEGCKERFFEKLEQNSAKSKQSRYLYYRIAGIAASLALIFLIGYKFGTNKQTKQVDPNEYLTQIITLEKEIIELSRNKDDDRSKELVKAAENVIYEPIPLEEQLPKELSTEECNIILASYYEKKATKLNKIKHLLALETKTK